MIPMPRRTDGARKNIYIRGENDVQAEAVETRNGAAGDSAGDWFNRDFCHSNLGA
ncbi:MAG: hypothetical protein OHK0029_20570 [Armatimonadaceae bacterium]